MTVRLTTAGSALMVSSDALPANVAQALPLSLLWCEGVARGRSLTLGSDAFFEAVSAEMGNIGWIVTAASITRYSASGSKPDPGEAILTIAGPLVPPSQMAALSTLFEAMARPALNGSLDSVLTTWWAGRRSSAEGAVFAAVPAGIDNNLQLTATLVQLDFEVSADSWQSFFLSRLETGTQVVVRDVGLTLQPVSWALNEDLITRKLGQAAIASIQSVDL